MAAADTLDQIAAEVQVCTLCDLHMGAKNGVPGEGNAGAEVMFIGEAPSLYDDRRGAPFSGPSGVFLDELLALVGMSRSSVYLTNMVKHRVPEIRDLLPAEITACAGYLTRQIALVNPKVIVALGRVATGRFFPKARITQMHGKFKLVGKRVVVAMYNPAAALHREDLRQTVIDDFTRAIPAALAEAQRLAAEGKLVAADEQEGKEPPEQLPLF